MTSKWTPTQPEIAAAWREAMAVWDVQVLLTPPTALAAAAKGADWGGREPLAYIDLVVRQVVVNFPMLDEIGARASLTAVLAHELGHHVRFPHTLGLAAQLRMLEVRLIPGLEQSLTNLFFDLQVNEHVGRTRAGELAAVYRGFVARDPELSPLFWFYLAIYEELWGLEAGALAPGEPDGYPGARAEARMFAQTFWALDDVFLQFVYFASMFIRYLPKPGQSAGRMPMAGDVGEPDLDDWASGMYGNAAVDRALEDAQQRGWLSNRTVEPAALDPLAAVAKVFGAPGKEKKAFREALVSRHYKRLVDEHLIKLPASESRPEPLVPTTVVEWEQGDDPRAIDWTASVLASGNLAPLRPLRRDFDLEPPVTTEGRGLGVEIYLDTSGSMPDPQAALNAMTLAAQILAASAIRRGGRARAVIYSSDAIKSDWMYDEEVARRYLLNYSGGGTTFPWKTLAALVEDTPDVVRVIVSDSDFLSNVKEKGARAILSAATARSRRLVTLLAFRESAREMVKEAFGDAVWRQPKLRVVLVDDLREFARMAADLARALFGGGPVVPFEVQRIRDELAAATLESPYSTALAVAVVSDVLRDGGVAPPSSEDWAHLISGDYAARDTKRDLRAEQIGLLAHCFASSAALRAASVERLRAMPPPPPGYVVVQLEELFTNIAPLTAEMMRSNVFRQEEAVRRWADAWGGEIAGEAPAVSARRLEQLDYRKTLVEYEKAEKARADEADKRAAALKAAQEAEAAARGWRE